MNWRCAAAEAPSLQRLARVTDVSKHCPECPGHPVGASFHMMWECVRTADLRKRFGLDLVSASRGSRCLVAERLE